MARIFNGMLAAVFPFVVSQALLAEYRAVLVRPALRMLHGLKVTEVDALLTDIAQHAIVLPPGVGSPAPDPGDQLLRDLLAAKADLLAEEVFVNAAEHVAGPAAVAFEADIGDLFDQRLELDRLYAAAGAVARKLPLQVRVVPLDGQDCVVNQRRDVGTCRLVPEVQPSGCRWHPEDPLGGVPVAGFEHAIKLLAENSVLSQLGLQVVAPALKLSVRDVLEKKQAKDNVLVLCSIDLTAEGVAAFQSVSA